MRKAELWQSRHRARKIVRCFIRKHSGDRPHASKRMCGGDIMGHDKRAGTSRIEGAGDAGDNGHVAVFAAITLLCCRRLPPRNGRTRSSRRRLGLAHEGSLRGARRASRPGRAPRASRQMLRHLLSEPGPGRASSHGSVARRSSERAGARFPGADRASGARAARGQRPGSTLAGAARASFRLLTRPRRPAGSRNHPDLVRA